MKRGMALSNIVIENLSKSYGKLKVLDNISMEIPKGNFGLLGPNGAGKTTLMRTLTTLLDIEKGNISYENIEWKNKNKVKEIIGYLPQEFSLYKNVKLYDVIYYLANLKGIKKNNIDEEVISVLELTKLNEHKNKKIRELSGGMLRRAGIAQALIGNPKILIIDEPTAGLDPERRIEFRNLINELSGEITLIISTHIVEDLEATCENICVLDKGKILFKGRVEELKNRAQGHIFEGIFNKEKFKDVEKLIHVINIRYEGNKINARFVSHEELSKYENSIVEVKPTLEDAYFYLRKLKNEE